MLSNYKNDIEKSLSGVAKNISWINPNALTLIGIIPQALFFIFMNNQNFVAAAIALIFTSIDMLDGIVARTNNKVTPFGGVLDSTVDRVGDFLIVAAFYAAGLARIEIVAVLIMTTFLISYVRSRAELASMGEMKFDQGLIERPERIIFLFLTLVVYIAYPRPSISTLTLTEFLLVIFILLSLYTLTQRIVYAYKRL